MMSLMRDDLLARRAEMEEIVSQRTAVPGGVENRKRKLDEAIVLADRLLLLDSGRAAKYRGVGGGGGGAAAAGGGGAGGGSGGGPKPLAARIAAALQDAFEAGFLSAETVHEVRAAAAATTAAAAVPPPQAASAPSCRIGASPEAPERKQCTVH
jgi:hypothetical protein